MGDDALSCLARPVPWPLCAAEGALAVGSELGFLKACTTRGLVGDFGKSHRGFLTPDHSWMKRMLF